MVKTASVQKNETKVYWKQQEERIKPYIKVDPLKNSEFFNGDYKNQKGLNWYPTSYKDHWCQSGPRKTNDYNGGRKKFYMVKTDLKNL